MYKNVQYWWIDVTIWIFKNWSTYSTGFDRIEHNAITNYLENHIELQNKDVKIK